MRCHFSVYAIIVFLPYVSLPRHLPLIGSLRRLCGICTAFAIGEAPSLWTTFVATVAVDVWLSLKRQMQQGIGAPNCMSAESQENPLLLANSAMNL